MAEVDDDDDDETGTVMLDFVQDVMLIRVFGKSVIPVSLRIKAELLPVSDDDEIPMDVIVAKLKFWFDAVVARCICVARSDTVGRTLFTDEAGQIKVNNNLMLTPFEPTDEHLAMIFQAKITALANYELMVGYVRINTIAEAGLVTTYLGNWMDDLPDMEAWFNVKPYFFDVPWWARNDISTIDMIPDGTVDFTLRPKWAITLDFIDAAMTPHHAEGALLDMPDTIIRKNFRPTIVEDDQRED
jgi:hypothetical protein